MRNCQDSGKQPASSSDFGLSGGTQTKTFSCEHCAMVFSMYYMYAQHQDAAHSAVIRCNSCDLTCHGKANYMKHVKQCEKQNMSPKAPRKKPRKKRAADANEQEEVGEKEDGSMLEVTDKSQGETEVRGEEDPQKCEVCEKSFATKRQLSRHTATHKDKPPKTPKTPKLPKTPKPPKTPKAPKTPMTPKTHKAPKTPRTPKSSEGSPSFDALSVKEENPQNSKDNTERLDHKDGLKLEIKTKAKRRRTFGKYICDGCSSKLTKRQVLRCVACEANFFSHRQFDLHLASTHSPLIVNCKICHKLFDVDHLLIKTLPCMFEEWRLSPQDPKAANSTAKEDIETKPLSAASPKSVQSSSDEVEANRPEASIMQEGTLVIDDAIEDLMFRCDECPKSFHKKHLLVMHLKTHCSIKPIDSPFICTICPLVFSNDSRLRGHMKTHTGFKAVRVPCETCQATFSTAAKLLKHKQVHKLYQCDHCPKFFKDEVFLRHHAKLLHSSCKPKSTEEGGSQTTDEETGEVRKAASGLEESDPSSN